MLFNSSISFLQAFLSLECWYLTNTSKLHFLQFHQNFPTPKLRDPVRFGSKARLSSAVNQSASTIQSTLDWIHTTTMTFRILFSFMSHFSPFISSYRPSLCWNTKTSTVLTVAKGAIYGDGYQMYGNVETSWVIVVYCSIVHSLTLTLAFLVPTIISG
jgi:hypothetical protein